MRKTKPKSKPARQAGSNPATSATAAVKPSRRRPWWFPLLAAIAVPVLLLFSTEGVLRLMGYGFSPHFFLSRQIGGRAVWTDNQDFGRRFFPPGLVRYPHSFTMPAETAPNTLRIFVLGESAALGDPDAKFGMPRMLEILLRERFSNRRIEVIDAAMVAINSHVILPIARECAQYQGDLWVIYMGNNEMIGPFGSASVFGAKAPPLPLIRAGIWFKTTRVGQLLDAALHLVGRSKQPRAWGGMEMMADQKVRYDAPATARVYQYFERNLHDILAAGAQAGVPILLCTVATNLKDCAPFASAHRSNLTASDLAQWQKAYDAAVTYEKQAKLPEAKAAYEQAAGIDGEYAELTFRHAKCCRLLGRQAEAANLFRQARDQDSLQFRADGCINDITRRSANAFAGKRVALLDAEGLFSTNSPQGVPGVGFFYEHVHLTPTGNYLLARAAADQAVRLLSLPSSGEWVSESECLRLLGMTDGNRYDILQAILDRMQGAPFTNQVNYAQELQGINEQIARCRAGTKPAQVKRDLEQVSELVARHPEDPDLRWNLAVLHESAGDLAGAEAEWRKLVQMQPQAALPAFNLAKVLDRLGRREEAYALFNAGLRINPEYYSARYALGTLCLSLGRIPEAIHHLNLTVEQKPNSIEPRLALAQGLARANRPDAAETQLREVLRLDPNNQSAQAQLRNLEGTAKP